MGNIYGTPTCAQLKVLAKERGWPTHFGTSLTLGHGALVQKVKMADGNASGLANLYYTEGRQGHLWTY